MIYAMAICPRCNIGRGETEVLEGDRIRHSCNACGFRGEDDYRKFNFWFYHKVLALPRLDIFNIDLCITGPDHYNEGDFLIRKKLIEDFGNRINLHKPLYTPMILGVDGKQMGKSKGNDVSIEIEDLIEIIKKDDSDRIKIGLSSGRENFFSKLKRFSYSLVYEKK
jgi:lysyl-tRNA synthetase class I